MASAVGLLLVVLTITFLLVQSAPGDPSHLFADPRVSPDARAAMRHRLGLDRPPLEQYLRWLGAAVTGNWGVSFAQGRPVRTLIGEALPASLLLAGAATALAVPFGLGLGLISARWRRQLGDHLARLLALTFYAQPPFWLGLMAILVGSRWLGLFPASHLRSIDAPSGLAGVFDVLWHLALPAFTLALLGAGQIARYTRLGLLDALDQDFFRTARANGLSQNQALLRHALPVALGPVIQLVGLMLPLLASGALAVEVVFAWPGLGRLAFTAIATRDLPVILATTGLTAALVIVGSLVADLAHAAVDPRVREGTPR